MGRRSSRSRDRFLSAGLALSIAGALLPLTAVPAAAQSDADMLLGTAAFLLTGVKPALFDPPLDRPSKVVTDPTGDTTGPVPAGFPPGFFDVEAGEAFIIPAANVAGDPANMRQPSGGGAHPL